MDVLLITWGVTALCGLGALGLAWPLWRRWFQRRRRARVIAASGVDSMRNVLLDNGMGGETFFEWLLLMPESIRVLATDSRKGIIFASKRMDTWAQVVGKQTTHFANPLYHLEDSLVTLRHHLPGTAIEERILFTGDCAFPKGRPDTVLMLAELEGAPKEEVELSVQPELRQAWEKLRDLARKVDPATESYLLPPREASTGRWLLVALLLLAAGAGPYWVYLM